MRIIKLPVYGIVINLIENGGGISSLLHEEDASSEYDAGVDAIESIVLAHACAGVDVEDLAYLEGIETAVQAIANNL